MKKATKAGRRNAAPDQTRIQQAHDLMAELGAACPTPDDLPADSDTTAEDEGKAVKQMSLDEQVQEVTDEIMKALAGEAMGGLLGDMAAWNEDAPCVCAVYPDYAIVRIDDAYYKAPYSINAATDEVAVAPFPQWQTVEQTWVAKMKAVTKTEGGVDNPASSYLVVEDPASPSTWHLRVKDENGKPDHRLMGAAWAALNDPNGYRGNKYTGPGKDAAVAKLTKLYDAEKMPTPGKTVGDTAIAYGQEVKALGNGRIGGYLVLFSTEKDPDLTGDFFTHDTDFGPHKSSIALYQHGQDDTLGRRVLDPSARLEVKDAGVWIEAQLALRDEYEQALYKLAEKGKLGWSSGTAAHLVERERVGKAYRITRWPLGLDASLTPTPAEPRTSALPLKALMTEVVNPRTGAGSSISIQEETKMTENVQPAPDTNAGELDALKAQIADLSTAVNNILKYVQDAPAIRKAGYVTEDGGKKDKNVKSFADFLLAVRRSDTVRLKTVYGTGYVADGDDETKDLGVNVGTSGGVLVPPDYSTQLLQLSPQDNGIVSRVTRVPVTLESGTYPSLDIFAAPTAGVGDTALAAGVTAAAKGEGATLGNTNPSFTELNWRVRKVGGYTKASNELIASSPQSIEALLTALFRIAIAAKTEYFILRGTGVGEPLGILNSAAAKSSSAASSGTYAYADALTMLSLFKPVSGVTAKFAWIMHPSLWPQIGKFQVGTSAQAWVANMQGTIAQQPLLGYPIIVSEHLPQHASSGDIILADLGAYLLFDREQLTIAFSEHIGFLEDQGTWRFTARMDGMPWMKNVITLPGPGSAYTVSPFVYNAN